ncbi:uncharacterized protein EV422DRAFT_513762 [Fimicolochytrium jonesii]|uniref:uncharacterized protein n=1 Tax=Fimicolochytrium jonesii TaxID=1396493 RepID=UPI0022FEBE24|nr:uncharacterized protein EV422DRAFT_513762 [Fimicolochytrium jonesii]KAI8825666.1 hypothetical protein EV422DRAFT_513762 [Fimicolochytrium jonesii]
MAAALKDFTKWGRSIVAVGRNYALHAKELNNPLPTHPLLFLKPVSSYLSAPNPILLPSTHTIHHELELGVIIGHALPTPRAGKAFLDPQTQRREIEDAVGGYVLALDMTARDLQDKAKKGGLPWTVAKGFDGFTPVGEFIDKTAIRDPHDLRLVLEIDGKTAQDGLTSDMLFDIPTLLAHINSIMTLQRGDLVLTGTPAGVGPVRPGQTLVGKLLQKNQDGPEGWKDVAGIRFPVAERPSPFAKGA